MLRRFNLFLSDNLDMECTQAHCLSLDFGIFGVVLHLRPQNQLTQQEWYYKSSLIGVLGQGASSITLLCIKGC